MDIGKRIKERREELNLSARDLAKRINKSKSSVYRYESGDIEDMPLTILEPLAKALYTTPAYLIGWSDNVRPVNASNENYISINVYGSVPAGVPVEAIEEIEGTVDIPEHWTSGGQKYIALRVTGDSMYPFYLDGDIVILRLQTECNSGDDVVVYVNGYDATLKTLIKNKDGSVTLKPKNPVWQEKTYGPDDEPLSILGVVVESRRLI